MDIENPGKRREVTPTVVRHVDTSGSGEGMVLYSQLNEANVEEIIREQVNYYESLRQDFEWKVYDFDKPPDLKERLENLGFVAEEAEAVMVLELEEAPDTLWQPVHAEVKRIRDPKMLKDVQAIKEAVWGEDFSWLDQYLGEALRNQPERMSVYLAYLDGQPACAAWIYFPDHSSFASLWGGATISHFRKKGLYTTLLATRAQEARERGVRYLTVDASPMSRPILENFGFEFIGYSYLCKWKVKSKKSSRAQETLK
jgi:GNAT superfamily N-acetyltransferase